VNTKARQASKIRELGEALVHGGVLTLDEQAKVLGLARSTTWTILKASHKASGLSASVVRRMLAAPRLPHAVRAKILEYVTEKSAGHYGHEAKQIRRFITGLAVEPNGCGRQSRPGSEASLGAQVVM